MPVIDHIDTPISTKLLEITEHSLALLAKIVCSPATVIDPLSRGRMEKGHGNRQLRKFLLETCKLRGLSLRKLSYNSGLSPGTVYSIINRKYQPTLYSLNRLSDYLGVNREYLWQLAGLLEGGDIVPGDNRLKTQLARAQELPADARDLLYDVVEQILRHYEKTAVHLST